MNDREQKIIASKQALRLQLRQLPWRESLKQLDAMHELKADQVRFKRRPHPQNAS